MGQQTRKTVASETAQACDQVKTLNRDWGWQTQFLRKSKENHQPFGLMGRLCSRFYDGSATNFNRRFYRAAIP